MITLMSQMVGCLLIAAGIGVAVGWLLRGLPKNSTQQPYEDLVNQLRAKEQALETTSHDLKVKTSGMQILEQKIMSSETLYSSAQRELTARGERVKALEAELAVRSKRLTDLEAEGVAARQRVSEVDAMAAAQTEELRGAQQACRAADQAREVMEQEIRVLREHIAQLNEGLADRDRLRAQVAKLESAQDRVHQLEVELSDREAGHRDMIQQLERSIAERDRRIGEFDASAAAQADKLYEIQRAWRTAEQAQEVLKEEIRTLRDHITRLNEDLADRDRLRAQVAKLESAQDRVHQLEVELSDREAGHRSVIQQLERSIAERDRRISEVDAIAAAQTEELRGAQQACRAADQAHEVMEQEIRVLREHIAQLNEGLADRDRLRAQVAKLESAQDRVHQLEVELSDREAGHRGMIQQLERSIAERDRRIEELVPVTHLLREKESELKEWGKNYARMVQEHEREVVKLQDQCAAQEQLRTQHLLDEQQLHERDEQIASLHRQLHEVQAERQNLLKTVQSIPGKDEHIDRLRKHLREIRAELRAKPASATPPSRPARQNGAELSSRGGPSKVSKDIQADDLKKINGIGPTLAQTLNKMGTRTFIQIARWKPEDIQKIAKKLDTDPERIKRDNWIADAKKQHYRKYGERL
ncbi:MAG: hypothetical protein OJF51_004772 [Nitrospira sp.]|jgi:predicted flap endonuclease-1-like 5' DNA nuclease|nr:MAG: hypothetical protein OJF51_004772 [Nitrospira sp.]